MRQRSRGPGCPPESQPLRGKGIPGVCGGCRMWQKACWTPFPGRFAARCFRAGRQEPLPAGVAPRLRSRLWAQLSPLEALQANSLTGGFLSPAEPEVLPGPEGASPCRPRTAAQAPLPPLGRAPTGLLGPPLWPGTREGPPSRWLRPACLPREAPQASSGPGRCTPWPLSGVTLALRSAQVFAGTRQGRNKSREQKPREAPGQNGSCPLRQTARTPQPTWQFLPPPGPDLSLSPPPPGQAPPGNLPPRGGGGFQGQESPLQALGQQSQEACLTTSSHRASVVPSGSAAQEGPSRRRQRAESSCCHAHRAPGPTAREGRAEKWHLPLRASCSVSRGQLCPCSLAHPGRDNSLLGAFPGVTPTSVPLIWRAGLGWGVSSGGRQKLVGTEVGKLSHN